MLTLLVLTIAVVVIQQQILGLLLNNRIKKLEHGLKTHGHGITYVDKHGNKIKRTDVAGNQVIDE